MTTTYLDRYAGAVVADMGKQPCDAATTVPITLSGYQTVDGINLNADYMRCLVKDQADQTTNGIYVVLSGAWMRASDFSGPSGTVTGQLIYVTGGSQQGLWQLTTPNPVQIDQSGGQSTAPSNITFAVGPDVPNYVSDLGFNNFIVSPVGDQTPPGSGLSATLPAVSAVVGNRQLTYPASTVTFADNSIIDIWGKPDGTTVQYTGTSSNYTTTLPQLTPTDLHLWRVYTVSGAINGIKQMSNTYPTVTYPTDNGYTNDNFVENFYLYDSTTDWSSTLDVTYGELLLASNGNVYQVYLPGTTGSVEPTTTAAGEITDGTATLFYYCQKEYLTNFRYAPNNGCQTYFTNIGLRRVAHRSLLTGSPLGPGAGTALTDLIKKYIINELQQLVCPRVNSGTYIKNMKMIAGGYIWLCTTAGTSNSSSPYSGSYTPGTSSVTDGTAVFKCIAVSYGSQKYFWLDTDRTFLSYLNPDSHDSYAATFISLIARYVQLVPNDAGFIFGVSVQPSGSGTYYSNKQLFDDIFTYNLHNQIANNLTKTFQGDVSPVDGSTYSVQFLEDACECYSGFKDANYLYTVWGDSTNAGYASTDATSLATGIIGLYDTTYNVFATQYGEAVSTWINEANKPFYPRLQAQVFPELHNVTTVTQDVRNNVRTWMAGQYQGWWQDKGKDTFPQNVFGFLAARVWQDFRKASIFQDNTERYYAIGGNLIISEFCYYLDIKDNLVNPYTLLQVNQTQVTIEGIDQSLTTLNAQATATFANAAAAFTITLPANAYICDIFVESSNANALTGGLDVGTTLSGSDVISALTVSGNTVQMVPQADILLRVFSTSASQVLYFGAHTDFNSANITVKVRYSYLQ